MPAKIEARTSSSTVFMADTVDSVSVWELRIKSALGKPVIRETLEDAIYRSGFAELPIRFPHAKRAAGLPAVHGDPFDRMLVAQAQIEDLEIATRDRRLREYDVRVAAA